MTAIRQFKERSFAMTGAGDPEEFDGVRVTWNVFASRPPDCHGECSRQSPRRYASLASERVARTYPLQENSAWPRRRSGTSRAHCPGDRSARGKATSAAVL